MSKFDVCYVVSLGFAARMVLHTNLVCELKKAGLQKIAIILPGKDDGVYRKYEEKLGVKIYYADFVNTFWSNEYMTFRKYVYEDIKMNAALYSKHLKSIYEYKGVNPWRKVKPYLYYSINRVTRKLPIVKSFFSRFENLMLRKKKLSKLIKDIDPKVLISTYPVNFLEGAAIKIGSKMGYTTVTQLLSWDNITCKGKFPALSDYYLSWGDIMTKELKEYYGIDDSRIFNTGIPHFDREKELADNELKIHYLKEMGLNSEKPYILFGMSSPFFSPREIDIVERLADLTNRNIFGEEMQLVIRPHPQNVEGEMADTSWIQRLKKLRNNRVGLDLPIMEKSSLPWNVSEDDLAKLSSLIDGCSVLLNSGSTILIEGLIHNKPVILTLFDADAILKDFNSARRIKYFPHINKIINSQALKVVNDYEELKHSIIKFIDNPQCNEKVRNDLLYSECGEIDGKSSFRISSSLVKIIKNEE